MFRINLADSRLIGLRVVSNFGDSDRGAGENTHTYKRKISGRRDTRGAPKTRGELIFSASLVSRLPDILRTRLILETTRILETSNKE